MEWNESPSVIIRDKNSVMSLVDVKQARLEIFGDLFLVIIGLDLIHLLYFLFFRSALNLVALIPLFEFLDLLFMKLLLRFLALLIINSLLNIL